ncbi:TIGR01244 family phosphatase [Sphingomonas oleivorans]|uniref:TIGR01244 family phosphatase n=1 Tax=Sphingomonas oleivorans TaxID=1735121 RepID=A0A2T5FU53_9SPHN|nr:TIGR01244 family sulfur transferase [Sphingomonas oleivorans]PTQ07810.1 TIGR01244 family phosphatase [Sphingomonas oleivorans]
MFRKLDDTISVAGQIMPEDVAEAAAQGFTSIINNRPDDEQPGQPSSAEIETAAKAAGLSYRAIPISHAGFSEDQVQAMREALEETSGPVLAFCRSGTRSTLVWALARSRMGDDPAALQAKARGAGYDISPVQPYLGAA